MKILIFSDVLDRANEFPWDEALFLPEKGNWSLDSSCTVMSLDDCEDDEENPKFAVDNGLTYALTIHELQGIVLNARQQRRDCSLEGLLEAFLYYYEYDAYLAFE